LTIEPGLELLHYRMIEKIGEGGMGVVWRARDTSLNRDVAIKLLPVALAADPDRRGRFEREAHLLATLNHPGIAGVYGLHESDGVTFIAMEYIPGEDLAERLQRGALSVEDAIDVAHQVAAALEEAHEQGVIHRDLKPANIKRTPEGKIKVLDLGLAKALTTEIATGSSSLSLSPTMTSSNTVAGMLMGTAAYMSPEQVKGKEADRRADIWAFGCVLNEMLTGRRTFVGETISETLASVLRDEAEEGSLPADTPVGVRRLLRRCLDRNRETRLRDIGEARIALSPEGLAGTGQLESEAGPSVAPAQTAASPRIAWTLAALALAALAVVSWIAVTGARTEAGSEIRATIAPPEDAHFLINGTQAGSLSISPDGTKMTFAASSGSGRASLYMRSLGSTKPQIIPGTEGATLPFWAPDSRQLGFIADGKLKKLLLDGGAPMTLAVAQDSRGGTWGADGTILFAPDTQSSINRVSVGGVEGEPVTTIDKERGGETTHRLPSFLPDQRHFLYVRGSHSAATSDKVNSIWVGDTESGDTFELMQSGTQARYAQGHIFWVNQGFLMARAFSVDELAFTGEAFTVGEEVVVQEDTWLAAYAVSAAGPILFQSGLAPERRLRWFDREGNVLGTIGEPGKYSFHRLSPDDRFLASTLLSPGAGGEDIWIFDVERDVSSRLTFDEAKDAGPVWSPDGSRIAFASSRDGSEGIYIRPASGRGAAELLYESEQRLTVEDWSPDGKHIAFNSSAGKADLWIFAVDEGEASSFITGEFDEGYARFSADSSWLSYLSNESGRYELYMTRFPGGEGKWQLTNVGADWLLGWNDAGDEVYYVDLEGKLCVVKVELTDQIVADMPECLFESHVDTSFDASSDGSRFILGVPDEQGAEFPITLVLNWAGAD
jgi:serine/threonine protein kinase/Tol biopolymer transport system component